MGMSNAPGTRTISICFSEAPCRFNASSAPRISGSTTKSLKRAATKAKRKSRASNSPSIIFDCSLGTDLSSHAAQAQVRSIEPSCSIAAIDVLGHFEVEGREALKLLRSAQHPHALQPEIL